MRILKFGLLSAMIIALTSCTPSIYPLFKDSERISDKSLEGVWIDTKHEGTNTFTLRWANDSRIYTLLTTMADQPATPGEFNALIGKLGKHRYLQIVPRRTGAVSAKSFFGGHFLQLYSFWRVEMQGTKLLLSPLNYRWVEAMVKAKKLDLKYMQREGDFIYLTATTEELQAFVIKHENEPGPFSDPLILERRQ